MGLFSGLTSTLGNIFQDPWAESNIGDVGNRLTGVYGQMEKSHQQGLQSAAYAQAYNSKMFDRQVELANSAHQREVEDLKKAGINPLYTVNGGSGASVPGAMSPGMASAGTGAGNGFVNTARSILDLQKGELKANVKAKDEVANTEKKKQELIQKQIDTIAAQLPAIQSASTLDSIQNDYEIIARRYLYNDKDYVGRDMGMRKMNLILPAALKTVNTASGVVNAGALASRAYSFGKLADRPHLGMVREFSNGMSYTDNYF